jgi:hypothetical protein
VVLAISRSCKLTKLGSIECNRASSDDGSRYSYWRLDPTLEIVDSRIWGTSSLGGVDVASHEITYVGFHAIGLVIIILGHVCSSETVAVLERNWIFLPLCVHWNPKFIVDVNKQSTFLVERVIPESDAIVPYLVRINQGNRVPH